MADFTTAALRDPSVLAAAARVIPIADSSLDWNLVMPPGKVEIVTHDGRRLERTGIDVPGSETAPMTWQQLEAKFKDCMDASVRPLPAARQNDVMSSVSALEDLEDVSPILRMLAADD